MATNQRQNIRGLRAAQASIAGLTDTQVLQLLQSETTAGAQADVGKLQVGDLVAITPNNIAANTIDKAHSSVIAGQGQQVARLFFVLPIFNDIPGDAPQSRSVLAEVGMTPVIFW